MRRRRWAALPLAALVVAGCSGSSDSGSPATTTAPAVVTSAASPGSSSANSANSATTRPSTTSTRAPVGDPTTTIPAGPASTNVPAGPCDAGTLLAAAQLSFGPLPEGAAVTDPRCVENYATAVLTAPGQDNAFAVFYNPEGEWQGVNLGTDQVCSRADVPLDFFGPLGCGPWEG